MTDLLFGTIGIRASVDLFEGGRKQAALRERETQLAPAKENLARISDEVELRVHTAYNKMERTRQMITVSEELLALRNESERVAGERLVNGGALDVAWGFESLGQRGDTSRHVAISSNRVRGNAVESRTIWRRKWHERRREHQHYIEPRYIKSRWCFC